MEEATTQKRPASFWFFAIGTALFVITGAGMLTHSLTSSANHAAKALMQGQRAIVHFESGKIEGGVFKEKLPAELPTTAGDVKVPTSSQTPDLAVPMAPNVPPANTLTPAQPDAQDPSLTEPAPISATAITIPQIGRGTDSLSFAPFVPMTEQVGEFTLPRIAPETKEVPWEYYGKPVPAPKRPMVAVVISGLGLSRSATDAALNLAPLYTLSFSPYAKNTPLWAINARNKGFETWVDLPVEPADYPASDPGPHAILGDKIPEDNTKNLYWTLSRFQGYSGVLVPSSEKLTSNDVLALGIAQQLTSRGLQMAYVKNSQNGSFTKQIGKYLVIPADENLDENLTQAQILKRLQGLVEKAKKNGHAIGQLRAYPVSLEALKNWTQTLKDSGVDLVPLTAVAKKIQ